MRHPTARLSPAPSAIAATVAAVALALAACAPAPGDDAEGAGGSGDEILWDSYGVPHIYAESDEAALFAFGWAQMHNHGDLVLRLYGRARGSAAALWGEDYVDSDRWMHTVGVPRIASEWEAALSPEYRPLHQAFVDGMNAYAEAHPDRLAEDARSVLPIEYADPLAHNLAVLHFTFVTSPNAVAAATRSWGRIAATGRSGVGATVPSITRDAAGSNAWAIGPSRSASGQALLLANPHLPWSDLFTWVEAQIVSPSLDVYGATLVGMPLPAIAFNDRLGWTHTVNTFDGADLYELTLADGGYEWDGGVASFETRTVDLDVLEADGTMRVEPLEIRESVHGPVVAMEEGRALALRTVGLDQPNVWEQYWDMLRATDLESFEAALRRLQMPMFTVMYADRDGRIMHLFGGRVPVRPAGDWNWSAIVPGDRSETLWTETHAYGDLPRVVDPASGWLQNANDPPWTTTFPRALDPEEFPDYMAPRGMAFRPQRSARMLAEDSTVTFDEMVAYKHSTRMELADRLLDDLLPRARAAGGTAARAAEVLDAWDRTADADSRGGVLFTAWWGLFSRRGAGPAGPFADPWDPAAPLRTPDGLIDPEGAVADLVEAATSLESSHGMDVAWGDLHRLRGEGVDLPANGGSGTYGIFRVTNYRDTEDGLRVAAGGDSYVAAMEFGETLRAMTLIGYGNASQPGSPHRTDQLELFSRKELRPVWRTEAEVRANLSVAEPIEYRR